MSSPSAKAWRKVARRISPCLKPSALAKVRRDLEQTITGAPSSAYSIPESPSADPFAILNSDGSSAHPYADPYEPPRDHQPGAVVRKMGTSRRVFILSPSLTPTEISGLAYRIRVMASNEGINSVVVANPLEDAECNGDMSENMTCLPSFLEEDARQASVNKTGGAYGRRHPEDIKALLHEAFGEGLGMPYVSSGYDAREVYSMGMHKDLPRLENELMDPLVSLSHSVRGSYDESIDHSLSKVPCVTFPHGLVTDAGYSFLLGSYVLATHSTAFRMLNPLRGLAFDPVGLSYLLPRVGWEFDQPSSEHSEAIAKIIALTGYEARAEDMVATGLATHYVGGPSKLNMLERAACDLHSFEYQRLTPPPMKYYGEEEEIFDVNDTFKNVPLANVIQHLSEYDCAGANEYGSYLKDELDETGMFLKDKDPSLTMHEERIQMYGELRSDLVHWAVTFSEAFQESTVEGIMESLREIAATKSGFEGRKGCEEDIKVADQAGSFVAAMECRSPLAMKVACELLYLGDDEEETLESCMEREKYSQARLFAKVGGDFARWAESGSGVGLVEMPYGNTSLVKEKENLFTGWTHPNVREVSDDEVLEIVGA